MTGSTTPVQALAFPRKALVALVATLAAAAPFASVQADTIAYEGFDYDAASLAGKNGGDGFGGAWGAVTGGSVNVVSPGLAAGDLPTTGNAVYINPAGTTTIYRDLASTLGANGSTTYISLLARQTEGHRFFGLSLFNGSTELLTIGAASGLAGTFPNWGMTVPGGRGGHTAFSSVGKTNLALLVLRIDSVENQDTLRLYVMSEPTDDEPVSASAAMTSYDLGTFSRIRLGAGDLSGGVPAAKGYIDEIRVATTWEDALAIPEPASVGLLLAGGLVMGLRGRQGRGEA